MIVEQPQVKRTSEIEEPTNLYVIHPMSRALVTLFARWSVSPNAVSVAGMAFGAAAAVAYYHYAYWPSALAGFLLMLGWHVMDGADGQLARLTGQASETGKVLDGLCDHVAFTLVYVSLAMASAQVLGPWVWGVAVLAGLSHLVQASTYEFQRQAYDFWVHGKESARIVMPDDLRRELGEKQGANRLFGRLYLAYLSVQHRLAGIDPGLVARLTAALDEPGGEAKIRETYRAVNLSAVRRWSLLCSNYRTIAIFAACLAGNPVYFFLFEIVVLNLTLVLLKGMQAERTAVLRARLARVEARPSGYPLRSNPV